MTPKHNFPTVPLRDVPEPESHAGRDYHRPLVMVVDDESSIADTIVEILSRSGYTATSAYDGETALETALLMPPDMLISDVFLPGMSGIDLAIAIRRIFPDCKIILFSGKASTADLLADANRNGHEFVLLNKPIHPADLLARISDGLKPHDRQPVAAR